MQGDVNKRFFNLRTCGLAALCAALQLVGVGLRPAHAAPFAYVASGSPSGIAVIDTAIDEIVAQVQAPGASGTVAVTADGKRVYWLSAFDSMSVLGAVTNSTVATLKVTGNGSANALAIAPDGKRVYLAGSAPGGGPGTQDALFIVVDTASETVTATTRVTGGGNPRSIVVDPTGAHVYIGTRGSVTVIDTASNTVTATLPLGPQSAEPALALTPDGRSLYVANPAFGEISVLNIVTNTLGSPFKVAGGKELRDIAINGAHAYVLEDGSEISIIDTASNAVLSTFAVPGAGFLAGIAFTPDGKRAYVTSTSTTTPNRVTVLDRATNKVVDTLTLTGPAGAIAIVAPAQ
jgi:YVTN family beta-propeller protein